MMTQSTSVGESLGDLLAATASRCQNLSSEDDEGHALEWASHNFAEACKEACTVLEKKIDQAHEQQTPACARRPEALTSFLNELGQRHALSEVRPHQQFDRSHSSRRRPVH